MVCGNLLSLVHVHAPTSVTMLCCLYCQLCSIYICSCLFVVPTCMFWTQFKFIFQHDHLIINNSKANGYSRTVPVDCSLSIQIIADRCYWWVWCVAIGTCLCWMNPIPSLSSSPACFAHSHDPNSFSTELCCKQVLVHTHCCNLLTAHLTIRTGCVLSEEMTTSYHGHAQTHTKGCTYRDYTGIVGFWHGSMHWCRRELARVCVRIYMWEGMYR